VLPLRNVDDTLHITDNISRSASVSEATSEISSRQCSHSAIAVACALRGRVQLVRRDGRDVSTLYGREGRGRRLFAYCEAARALRDVKVRRAEVDVDVPGRVTGRRVRLVRKEGRDVSS
jgi:hypothetical protein